MLARKCDRCGKLYEQYEGKTNYRELSGANGVKLIDVYMSDNGYDNRKRYDLCPECMAKLVAFLNGGNHDGGN